jgi:hypothetical protein
VPVKGHELHLVRVMNNEKDIMAEKDRSGSALLKTEIDIKNV